MAKPLIEEIASAPHDLEDSVALTADLGPIEVRWFIDDVDTVDICSGRRSCRHLIDAVHERWSET